MEPKTAEQILDAILIFSSPAKEVIIQAMKEYAEQERRKAFYEAKQWKYKDDISQGEEPKYKTYPDYSTNNPLQ